MKRPCNGDDAPLKSVHIGMGETWNYEFTVGLDGVTAIEWGSMNGHMAPLPTVRVFKNGQLHSEHPFCNCIGVEFAPQKDQPHD